MYCKKCGAENDLDVKFCVKCGSSLEKEDNKNHDSIFRKVLKKVAKSKPKSSLCGLVLVQIMLSIILLFIMFLSIGNAVSNGDFNSTTILAYSGLVILGILLYFGFSIVIFVGMMKASLIISRNEKMTFCGAVKGIFNGFNYILKAIGGILLYTIGISILSCIPIVGAIAALILQVYFLPVMVTFVYMNLDCKYNDMSMSDMFHKAMDLVNGHRVEFYGLMFSFIGWMLLSVLTLGLLYIWLLPYIMLAMANWYLALNGEVNFSEGEQGLSNIAIIAITSISYFVIVFTFVFGFIFYIFNISINSDDLESEFNDFTSELIDDTYGYDDSSLDNGSVVNMSGINVYIPSSFIETTMANYDKIYKSPYGAVFIGTNAKTFNGSRDEFVQTLLAQYASMGFECKTEEVRNINDNNWVTFDCDYNETSDVYVYLAQNDDKLYYLIITDVGDLTESKKLLDNIESNLGFAY